MQKKDTLSKSNNKGIALITLVVTVLMLIIISSVIIYNSTNSLKIRNLNNMYNDVRLLNEQVFLYYSKYEELPIVSNSYLFKKSDSEISSILLGYEKSDFYVIDIDKIDRNIKSNLEYGKDYYNGTYNQDDNEDVYIINTKTHQIFYAKGILLDKKVYYTIPSEEVENGKNEYDQITVDSTVANPPILEDNLQPVKYESSSLVEVNFYDVSWYDYTNNIQTWARAKTKDNAIYMWVPRFAYRLKENNAYDIVFLKGNLNQPIDTTKDITGEDWVISNAFKDEKLNNLSGIWVDVSDGINSADELISKLSTL